jgi:hypothetical protein
LRNPPGEIKTTQPIKQMKRLDMNRRINTHVTAKTLLMLVTALGVVITRPAFSATTVTGDNLKIGTSTGASHNLSGTASSIAAGDADKNSGNYSLVGGGQNNTNSGSWAFIGGGNLNVNASDYSLIAGGRGNNIISGFSCFIGGGEGNHVDVGINGGAGSIVGGFDNTVSQEASAIVGGYGNTIETYSSFIGAGDQNEIELGGIYSVIGGGSANYIQTNYSVIGGGQYNISDAGYYGVIGGGYKNTNSAAFGVIGGGDFNRVTGSFSTVPGGVLAHARSYGQVAHASGSFDAGVIGQAQASEYVLRGVTTNSTPTELFLDNVAARMSVPSGQSWTFNILVVARSTTGGNTAGYQVLGVIENNGGTTSLVGSASKTVLGEDVPAWDITVSADDTNDALVIKATGDNSTIRWVATVRTAEVAL